MDMLKIIDKAEWQIDGGVDETIVVQHFQNIFNWLHNNNMLTDEGEEIFEFGIDEEISIHERLITSVALDFLEKNYDSYISSIDYGKDVNCDRLTELYKNYLHNKKETENET
jgi:hypothetical protein